MGRNGAGKTTLLRTIAGLIEPVRGRVEAPRGVALLPQNPGDLLVRERVAEELPGEEGLRALAAVGLEGAAAADPRDLSGGERQRLALAIVMGGRAGTIGPRRSCLDEPTRGMDRSRKEDLAAFARELAARGSAVAIATHDVEFAAGVRRPRRPARRRRGDRRRLGRRAALRRLVLRDRGRAGPRPARRDHAGAGRERCALQEPRSEVKA